MPKKGESDILFPLRKTPYFMEITAQVREKLNKGANREARASGFIPAELYGHGLPNRHIVVNAKEFGKAFKVVGESTLLQLVIGKEKAPVLVHEIHKNPLTEAIQHIDFYQVKMDEKIKSDIALTFIHEAPAVKEKKGTLNKSVSEIEVEALPADLPHDIEISLASLTEVGMSIHVKDLKLSSKVKVLSDPEMALVTVVPLAEEEVVPVGPTTVDEVKVESELKKEERDKEKVAKED